MAIADLTDAVRRALGLLGQARRALVEAADELAGARDGWAAALHGTHDRDVEGIPMVAEQVGVEATTSVRSILHAQDLLNVYLGNIGAASESRSHAAPADDQQRGLPASFSERVRQARSRIGRRPDSSEARAEWVRSDGWTIRLSSGGDDWLHAAVKEFVLSSFPARERRAVRLARHVEVKVAIAMRKDGLNDETVVLDRQVCGTRAYDRDAPLTCDRYLGKMLPAGSQLRVVEPDGTIRLYKGDEPT